MKRRRVSKDKKTKIPKKYLSGLKGGKRSARASLIKAMSSLIDYCISLLTHIKAIVQRVSKWGSLSFPMNILQYIVM